MESWTPAQMVKWVVRLHNQVNQRNHKRVLDMEEVKMQYTQQCGVNSDESVSTPTASLLVPGIILVLLVAALICLCVFLNCKARSRR